MSLALSPVHHTYSGTAQIDFITDADGLHVTIDTDRLHIRSVQADDVDNYTLLFGDAEVMSKFAEGKTKTREDMVDRINNTWVKRWKENDPYSGFAILEKDSEEFVGHIVLGHIKPGQSELAYLLRPSCWKQGYGTEAVTALVKEYAPATLAEKYTLEGKPLKTITATARPDNPGSFRILEKVGMHLVSKEEKYGALRHHYSISLNETQKKTSDKVFAIGHVIL